MSMKLFLASFEYEQALNASPATISPLLLAFAGYAIERGDGAGEYIAVEKVEAAYKKNPVLEQFWVYGNSFESFLVAVAVPNAENLAALAKHHGITGTFEELAANPEVTKLLLSNLTETAKAGHLKVRLLALLWFCYSLNRLVFGKAGRGIG
jgi:hypothetical protein